VKKENKWKVSLYLTSSWIPWLRLTFFDGFWVRVEEHGLNIIISPNSLEDSLPHLEMTN
jgi:hypothetical protein